MHLKNLRYYMVAMLAMFLVACSGSGPETTAEKYVRALADGKADKALGYVYIPQEHSSMSGAVGGKLEMMAAQVQHQVKEAGGIKSVSTISSELSEQDSRAKVTVRITFKNGTTDDAPLKMLKTKDGWKVDL